MLPWNVLNHGLAGKTPVQSCPARGRQGKGKTGVKLKGMGASLHGKHIRGELGKWLFKRSALPTPSRPPTQPGVDTRAVQPVWGHTRAGAWQGGTRPFKPVLDILLLAGLRQKGFVMLRVAIKHTKSQRAFFGGLLAVGKSHCSALQEPPVAPGNRALGLVTPD